MKVSTRGRVTIPRQIRDCLGIHPSSEVEFQVEGEILRLTLVRKGRCRARCIVERLRGRGTVKLTTDEIMALTREP